jgi:hypothetical protein
MCKIDCTSNNDNKKWAIQQNVKALPTFILFKVCLHARQQLEAGVLDCEQGKICHILLPCTLQDL